MFPTVPPRLPTKTILIRYSPPYLWDQNIIKEKGSPIKSIFITQVLHYTTGMFLEWSCASCIKRLVHWVDLWVPLDPSRAVYSMDLWLLPDLKHICCPIPLYFLHSTITLCTHCQNRIYLLWLLAASRHCEILFVLITHSQQVLSSTVKTCTFCLPILVSLI